MVKKRYEESSSSLSSKYRTRVIQVTNIAPQTTKDQMQTLFGYVGKIDDIRLYPTVRDVAFPVQSRVCYVKFSEYSSIPIAQHLTNTVFIDRALIILPILEGIGEIPSESKAMQIQNAGLPNIVSVPEKHLPPHVTSQIQGMPPNHVFVTVDPNFAAEGIPPYPPLRGSLDSGKVEEIRRTITVLNVKTGTMPNQILDLFNEVGEVKYIKMCDRKDVQGELAALVEFSEQASLLKAFKISGTEVNAEAIQVTHSTEAIVKPHAKSNEAAQREIEEAMRRVREAQNMISASIDPGEILLNLPKVLGLLEKKRSRSRSRSRRRSRSRSRSTDKHRSRSRRRSRSREKRKSRSRSRDRKRKSRSRSKDRKRRSRSRNRDKRCSRSMSGARRSRSRSKHRRTSSVKDRDKDKDKKKEKRETEKVKEEVPKEEAPVKSPSEAPPQVSASSSPRATSRSLRKSPSPSRSRSRRKSRSRSRTHHRLSGTPKRKSKSPHRRSRSRSRNRKDKKKERERSKERDRRDKDKKKDRKEKDRKDRTRDKERHKGEKEVSVKDEKHKHSPKVSRNYDEEEEGYEPGSAPPQDSTDEMEGEVDKSSKGDEDMDISD